ncbi:MAG TPA: ABC transporter ATP-binding protein [Fimbriimonadaceae bacterium]
MIEVSNLKKSYGSLVAVDGVSLTINKGEMFGLLGPNGAGKSTTISIMAGLLKPDSGTVKISGDDPISAAAKKRIGLAPQSLAIYERLTAEENLMFFGKLSGLGGPQLSERTTWALELAGLADRRKDIVGTFSGGMKRRLNLVCALVHAPEVVFLDEPTVGVDPQSRNFLFDTVEKLRDEGLTIIYTTHYMEEAERLCDRVAIMDQGKILAQGTVQELIGQFGAESTLIAEFERMPDSFVFAGAEVTGSILTLKSKEPFADMAKLAGAGVAMKSLKMESPNLETVFLNLTGRSLRD